MVAIRATIAAALLVAVTACAEPDAEPLDAPWVHVGHGLHAYEPVEDGDAVEMVLGSQGGWHVDLASHVGGTGPEDHFAIYRVWDLDKSLQISYPIKAFVTHDKVLSRHDGTFEQVGIRTVFAVDNPDVVRNKQWLIEVELIVDNKVFVDERVVVVVDAFP